ncbi:hypothetical protein [Streptomyces akebiae]|uniref:Uncharacterized protein n=1 Tax=Streptomyces akebiae TaxID=2865673 RepID=A0ABX8XSD0_9ACTN|nr:hypothetical protein [Streptomyces akebiae]QYX78525.1 hypothetical protein K1J60_19995 [Streptomyces akebiae]
MSVSEATEVLYDKEISLVAHDGEKTGRLLAEFKGSDYTVRVTCGSLSSRHTAWNLFQALAQVREDLEQHGLKPAVEGACIDVYPSRMALEMGGGRRAYHWAGGGRPATVDIFDDVPPADHARLVSVNAQRIAHEQRQGSRNE